MATKSELKELEARVDKRFDAVDRKVDALDHKIDGLKDALLTSFHYEQTVAQREAISWRERAQKLEGQLVAIQSKDRGATAQQQN